MQSKSVAIIGSGVAGLATAIRLAVAGYRVSVFEQNSYLGGKLTHFEQDGYRFDAGPSLFTLPNLVEELFELCNEHASDFFQYQKLETACHYFFPDGSKYYAPSDLSEFIQSAAVEFQISKEEIQRHFETAAFDYARSGAIFLEKSLHKPSTWLNTNTLRTLLTTDLRKLSQSMHANHAKIGKDKRFHQLLDRFATYNGSNPYSAPALLSMICHLEHGIGAAVPKGGMIAINEALAGMAKRKGVQFFTETAVDEILIEQNKVKGIRIEEKKLNFDLVVSNVDTYATYKHLLGGKIPKSLQQQERSSSALIFYWGIKKEFPELDLHNILFSSDYQAEFQHIFQYKTLYEDPTVYINIGSKFQKEDAPEGCENWFVMVNVPAEESAGISAEENQYQFEKIGRKLIVSKINEMLNTDIEQYIETEAVLTPNSIYEKTSSVGGSLYGSSSNSTFSAFLRQSNFSRKYQNLYFCGGSAHPGGGIPLCLLSAKITAECVQEE